MAGRCTKGFYDIMGIDDPIANDKSDYVRVAVRLATDIPFRRGVERQSGRGGENVRAAWLEPWA